MKKKLKKDGDKENILKSEEKRKRNIKSWEKKKEFRRKKWSSLQQWMKKQKDNSAEDLQRKLHLSRNKE